MKPFGKRLLSLALCALLLCALLPFPGLAAGTAYHGSGLYTQPKLSKEEIAALLRETPTELEVKSASDFYDLLPVLEAPYAAGRVKQALLERCAARFNALRAIAGLPAVPLDEAQCESAQYGAALLAVSGFSHTPSRPDGMDDRFYQQGYAATSANSIFWSSHSDRGDIESDLIYSVDSLMDDSDARNISRLGHRRRELDPLAVGVGFGYAVKTDDSGAEQNVVETVRYGAASGNYDFIGWPASGYFPNSIFDSTVAWSVSLNPYVYQTPSAGNLSVTLRRDSDGYVWRFSSEAADGDFYVTAPGYNTGACIIFRPEKHRKYGELDWYVPMPYKGSYTVTVTGLRDSAGRSVDFAYQTTFFDPENPDDTTTFEDIDFYDPAVLWAWDSGVTRGVSGAAFDPWGSVTRGQAATFLWRAAGCPEPEGDSSPFTDLTQDYYKKAVQWAVEQGITQGTSARAFSPDATCTYEHIVTFLYRAVGEPGKTGEGEWHSDAMRWAEESELFVVEKDKWGTTSINHDLGEDCPRYHMVFLLWKYANG